MLFTGRQQLDHGKRDLGILMRFGNTGLMTDLVSLSFSRYLLLSCIWRINRHPHWVFIELPWLSSNCMVLIVFFLQLAEDLGALPVWVFNCGILQKFCYLIFHFLFLYSWFIFLSFFFFLFVFGCLLMVAQESATAIKLILPQSYLLCKYAFSFLV